MTKVERQNPSRLSVQSYSYTYGLLKFINRQGNSQRKWLWLVVVHVGKVEEEISEYHGHSTSPKVHSLFSSFPYTEELRRLVFPGQGIRVRLTRLKFKRKKVKDNGLDRKCVTRKRRRFYKGNERER